MTCNASTGLLWTLKAISPQAMRSLAAPCCLVTNVHKQRKRTLLQLPGQTQTPTAHIQAWCRFQQSWQLSQLHWPCCAHVAGPFSSRQGGSCCAHVRMAIEAQWREYQITSMYSVGTWWQRQCRFSRFQQITLRAWSSCVSCWLL